MMFSKNKTIDLVKLKQENPEAYDALMSDAKTAVEHDENVELTKTQNELAQYKNKEARIEIDAQITNYGKELKVEDIAKDAIKEELNFADALVKMVDSHIKEVKDIEASFEETASTAAGESLEDGNEDNPKSFHEAMNIIVERDKCTKKEASTKAQKEFPKLFAEKFEKRVSSEG